MSRTSRQAIEGPQDRTERVHRWTAALVTALVHMLLVLLVMQNSPIAMTPPQSEAGGSRMNVTLIDETLPPSPPEPVRSNNPPPVGPNMGVDGFQVYYDLDNETRLRAWRDQGMTELFLPMPGTRRLMVCPLEVALRRGSSVCRMVEMDSPELKSIGDAREVINIQRVYQLGDVVWSGPDPYR